MPAVHTTKVVVYHHFQQVFNCTVAVKENVSDFPGWNITDYDFVKNINAAGETFFEGLLSGRHAIMGLGYDGQDSVKGYGTLVLDAGSEGEIQKYILYVTE